jgi:hypothetical protein
MNIRNTTDACELQDSLSKLNLQRTQVNNISEKSEQLISSFTSVLRSIESISDGVEYR